MRKFTPADQSGLWSLVARGDSDPAAVMRVIAALIGDTRYLSTSVTNAQARVISDLFRVDPEIEPLEALYLARRYVNLREREEPTQGLDNYVGVRGWTLDAVELEGLEPRGLFEGVGRASRAVVDYTTTSDSLDAKIRRRQAK